MTLAQPWGKISVGTATITEESGLSFESVVCANEHGDAVFAVHAHNPAGLAMADAHADELVGLLEVLGLDAERGEVSLP